MKNFKKTHALILVISIILFLSLDTLAQDTPASFTGKWIFNEPQSNLNGQTLFTWGNGMPFTIAQTKETMIIDQSNETNKAISKIDLNLGTAERTVETQIEGQAQPKVVKRTGTFKWINKLSFSETLTDENSPLSYSCKVYTLSPDLKKLVVEAKITYNKIDYTAKLVYDKQ